MAALSVTITEEQARLMHVLAQEIARGYLAHDQILHNLGLSEEDYDVIERQGIFQKLLAGAIAEWNSATNTAKRIKLKSQWAVEETIPTMVAFMTDPKEPLSARVETFKTIARIGQLGNPEPPTPGDGSNGFHIEINIGQGVAPITIDSAPLQILEDGEIHEDALQAKLGFEYVDDPPGYEPTKFSE